MSNNNVVRGPQIARLCRALRAGGALFVASILGIFALTSLWPDLSWWGHPFVVSLRVSGLPINALSALTLGQRLIVAACGVPYLIALAWAFYRLDRLLRDFGRGQFFERATVGHLRAFAGWLLVAKGLALVALHVRVAALMHFLGPGQVHAVINLSSDDAAVLLICALLFLIARMMEVGHDLAEENRGFV
jgi:hypothetical protein